MTDERREAYYKRMREPERCVAYLEALMSKDPHRIRAEEEGLHISDYLTIREFLLEIRQGRA